MQRNTSKPLPCPRSYHLALPGLCHLCVGILTVTALFGCEADATDPLLPPPQEGAPCALRSQLYQIDDVELPLSTAAASSLGLDLDTDPSGRPDNGAGVALSWLLGSWHGSGTMLHAQLRAAFEEERVLWLVEVETCADYAQEFGDYVRIGVHRGVPSGAHGTAEVADLLPPAEGWQFGGGIVRAHAGEGMVPASALMDFQGIREQVAWVRGDGLSVELQPAPVGEIQGKIGLGCDDDLRAVAAAVMSEFYTRKLGEGTSDFAGTLDADDDGIVSPEEFLQAEAIRTFLADDVDLMAEHEGDMVFWPRHDGINDRLSFGLWFHARLIGQ